MPSASRKIHVVEILEATDGGTRTHLLHILDHLDRERFEFTLIASRKRHAGFRRDMERLAGEGVRVIELPMVRAISPWRDTAAMFRLRGILRRLDCDIVHTHASKAGALGRVAAWGMTNAVVLHTPHALYYEGMRGAARRVFRAAERALMPLTTHLVLLTEAQRRMVAQDFPRMAERCSVIPNGVDLDLFAPGASRAEARRRLGLPENAPTAGTITRFLPQKAPEILLRGLAEVFKQMPEARGVIVGDGAQREEMLRLAEQLGARERIQWLPRAENPREIYAALDVFALPSRYEGMAYTLIEAMAMGLPVVATRIGGMDEVVEEGKTGLLVPADSPEALGAAVCRILQEPATAAAMGRAARAAAERFSLARFVRAMEGLYEWFGGRAT